jgi:hypothetical protein
MDTQTIRKGCSVRRKGDSAIGVVDVVGATHATVDYVRPNGITVTTNWPLNLLEIVHVPEMNEKQSAEERRFM